MSELWLDDPLGERPLATDDLPLSLGGPGAAVVIPGAAAGEIRARIVSDPDGWWLERENGERQQLGAAPAELDGTLVSLQDGEGQTRIIVRHQGVSNVTEPPQLEGQPLHSGNGGPQHRIPIPVIDYQPPSGRVASRRAPFRWRRAAAWSGAAIVAAVIAFLVAATAVTVRTVPEVQEATIDFVGTRLDLGFGGRYLVLPGDYRLEVIAGGYAPASEPVSVARAPQQRIDVALQRLPGRVAIDTGGLAATLMVDGEPRGALPGEIELAAGGRELTITAPRHAVQQQRFEVTGGGERQALSVTLEPLFAPVSVSSIPAGARLLVDDEEVGVTPLEVELDAGRHSLDIIHPQFRRFETEVTVLAGEPLAIGPVELGMPDGTLRVVSEPAGADVSIAGRYRGRTPIRIEVAPGVPHEVAVSRPGYGPATQSVTVASRAERVLRLQLEAVLGEVQVRGEPADATLHVDGASRGSANQTLTLPAAPHVIEVRKAGLETFRATVTPRAGQRQVVEFSLQGAAEARAARLAPRVSTALGQELILVQGGRFTMGSPRREPGRRSNEAERNVELKRPFYLAKQQVTNREFREFRKAHASGIYKDESLDLDRQPVVRISWEEAAAFCNWLSTRDKLPPAYETRAGRLELAQPVTRGYRLPTEAEWEFATRHDGRVAGRKYPWGNDLPVAQRSGNWADSAALYLVPVIISGYDDGARVAAAVGSFPANPLGFHDLGGNVFEWTSDHYSIYVVASDQYVADPTGPAAGDTYVVRGASWMTGRVPELRAASRDAAASGRPDLGFRIARYAE